MLFLKIDPENIQTLCQTTQVQTLEPDSAEQLIIMKYFSFLQHVNRRDVENS